MTDSPHDQQDSGAQAQVAQAVVGEQLRTARAEVFRAYLQSRERARALAAEEHDEAERHGPTAS